MIEVDTPEGVAEFPDGTPPDVIKGALQRRFANAGVVTDEPGGGWDQGKANDQALKELEAGWADNAKLRQAIGGAAATGLATGGLAQLPGAAGVLGAGAVRLLAGAGGASEGSKRLGAAGKAISPGLGTVGKVVGGVGGGLAGAFFPEALGKLGGPVIKALLSRLGPKGAAALEEALAGGGAEAAAASEAAPAAAPAAAAAPTTLEGILGNTKKVGNIAERFLKTQGQVGDALPQGLELAGAAAEPTLLQAAKAAEPTAKLGQKIWILLKDGKFAKTLTPDQARAAEAAGEAVTWVKAL